MKIDQIEKFFTHALGGTNIECTFEEEENKNIRITATGLESGMHSSEDYPFTEKAETIGELQTNEALTWLKLRVNNQIDFAHQYDEDTAA